MRIRMFSAAHCRWALQNCFAVAAVTALHWVGFSTFKNRKRRCTHFPSFTSTFGILVFFHFLAALAALDLPWKPTLDITLGIQTDNLIYLYITLRIWYNLGTHKQPSGSVSYSLQDRWRFYYYGRNFRADWISLFRHHLDDENGKSKRTWRLICKHTK